MSATQSEANLVPTGKDEHMRWQNIAEVPESNWYCYTLMCAHQVYSRVRIRVPRDYGFMEHYIRCAVTKHEPMQWQAVIGMEAATDDFVRNVSSGSSFILPNRIMRVDGHYSIRIVGADETEREVIRGHNSGNPYPYVSGDRDY